MWLLEGGWLRKVSCPEEHRKNTGAQRSHLTVQERMQVDGEDESNSSTQHQNNGDKKLLYEIDFIGEDTYRVSQNYILQKRSLEPIIDKDSLAALSARGLYHRDKEFFSKELTNTSQLISSISKRGVVKKDSSHQLYCHYFNRALAYERLHQTDKAIEDYSTAIKNGPSESQAYFNRAGLQFCNILLKSSDFIIICLIDAS